MLNLLSSLLTIISCFSIINRYSDLKMSRRRSLLSLKRFSKYVRELRKRKIKNFFSSKDSNLKNTVKSPSGEGKNLKNGCKGNIKILVETRSCGMNKS